MVEMVNYWMENLVKIYMPILKWSDMIEFVATHGTKKKHYSF